MTKELELHCWMPWWCPVTSARSRVHQHHVSNLMVRVIRVIFVALDLHKICHWNIIFSCVVLIRQFICDLLYYALYVVTVLCI